MKTLKQTFVINAPVDKVWGALIDSKTIAEWGGGPAEINSKEGTSFKMWGGQVYGKNLEVTKNKKLVQEWYGGDWPSASKVTITLIGENGTSRIDLLHENVPDEEVADLEDGWGSYFFGPIKKYLEEK